MNKKHNLYFIAASILFAAFSLASCNKEEGGIEALTIKEAVYVSGENYMGISLKDNETLKLTPFVMPRSAEIPPVAYTNRHPEIMEISNDGLITPKAPGRDTLTVSTTSGSKLSVSYVVNIIDHKVKATGITVGESGRNMLLRPGETFNLAAQVTVAPADTWDKTVTYTSADETIATVSAAGIVSVVGIGETVIRIATTDGSNITTECNVKVQAAQPVDINRSGWKVANISHTRPVDAAITNAEDSHIDGNAATSLSLIKPGRTYGGITVGANDEVSFTLDLGKEEEFNYVRIQHRNSQVILRVHGFTLLGSNDNVSFTEIAAKVAVPNAENGAVGDSGNIPVPTSKYRYVKFVYTSWDNTGGSAMQIAEFYLGIVK